MTREEYVALHGNCVENLLPHGGDSSLVEQIPTLKRKVTGLIDQELTYRGKVRDRLDLGDRVLLYTTDRVSAFDVVLGQVPLKGEVLNSLSAWWFDATDDIIPNHVIEQVGGRGLLCKKAQVLPVEVVVRGYLTGSAWRDYEAGRPISGIQLPPGYKKDQKLPTPLITPSTKEELGKHDMPISSQEIVERGLVGPELWAEVEAKALALFARGQSMVGEQGLLLVDTKYEFGLIDGQLHLVDEVHTPDSSRFWYADTYEELFLAGKEQRKLDKEYLRAWLMEKGWQGHGEPPTIPQEVFLELGWRYVQAWQEITGGDFLVFSPNQQAEAAAVLSVL